MDIAPNHSRSHQKADEWYQNGPSDLTQPVYDPFRDFSQARTSKFSFVELNNEIKPSHSTEISL